MFYDSPDHTFPDPKFEFGRWLGPARDVDAALTYHILKQNGEVIPRSTVRHLSVEELDDPVMQQKMKDFVANIDEQLGVACTESDFHLMPLPLSLTIMMMMMMVSLAQLILRRLQLQRQGTSISTQV